MKKDAPRLQSYLRKVFNSNAIKVVPHAKKKDLAEVMVGDEFLATVYRDEEDGEVTYQLQMAILEIDLDGGDA